MIKLNSSLMSLVFALLILSCSSTPITLNDFIFEGSNLPCNCSILTPAPGDSLPFNIPTNPYLSSDTSFINLAPYVLGTDELNTSIKTGLFSVYQCENELGIVGIEFNDPAAAEKCEGMLKKMDADTSRFCVFRNGNIVIQLWRDDVADSCYSAFRELIQKKINKN